MRGKILIKNRGGEKQKIKIWHLILLLGLVLCTSMPRKAEAAECPDVRVVFARGSGSERWTDKNYLEYKNTIESKLKTTNLNYEFVDLDYPAIGIDNLEVLVGAYVGSGEAYAFGNSVKTGVQNLIATVNDAGCPGTKYVVGGYSQGAMVVSKALGSLSADRMIYAATFGDPKLYLSEGKGAMPAACKGENLSDYRMYVPDCQAYKGLLGAYIPYEPMALSGKVGTWCNKRDIFCSSHLSISDHISYVAENLYEDAARVIFDKICQTFGITNTAATPHDTAILIDSTGSMSGLIAEYKAEALTLAKKTLAAGGRVALYDYRDYQEGYEAKQRCAFETCTLASFQAGLDEITADGGGDENESLLASSMQVMQELNWKKGSTKSIVVLTDAGYHEPDFDINGTTRLDVVALSKKIDPVNFYVITPDENVDFYQDLTLETGGRVVAAAADLSELTDYIMARYDSLPRVEESTDLEAAPVLEATEVTNNTDGVMVRFSSSGRRVLVALNDAVVGIVEGNEVTIGELDFSVENVVTLVPLGDEVRGEAVEVKIAAKNVSGAREMGNINNHDAVGNKATTPKAPNTGQR